MNNIWIELLVTALATWRLSNMLADTTQRGPFGVLDWLRNRAGIAYDQNSVAIAKPGSFGEGILCVFCNSVWIGLAFAALYLASPTVCFYVALPLAFSSVAILIEEHR